jgi:hypothetical protein
MKSLSTIAVALAAMCGAGHSQYLLPYTHGACDSAPRRAFTVSKVYETDALGRKVYGSKPVAIVETNERSGVSKV